MNQIVLITGASSGIGRAIAEYLASQNLIVYAGARKQKDIESLNANENIRGIKLDVTNPEQIREAVLRIASETGQLDCLINNAGIMGWGSVIDRGLDYFKNTFETNVWGIVSMVKAFYPLLKCSQNNPVIFNISSQGANYTLPFWSPYMMSKFAQEAFSGCLRREFLQAGIRVVSIAPGSFKSNMFQSQLKALDEYEKKYTSEFSPRVVKMLGVPIRKKANRGLSPESIGELIYKVMQSKKAKARYEPGKRLIPDVLLQRFPTRIVDKLILRMIS